MRYFALACDFDGTIADGGAVSKATLNALRRVSASGRRLVLVTGRLLDDLLEVFPDHQIFDVIVAENGAVSYLPSTKEKQLLSAPVPESFYEELLQRKVKPLARGSVIVATREPHEKEVLEAIRAGGMELQIIFNKGAVMVLPSGVNKASGLAKALDHLGLSPHNAVGVGDAENDHAFLQMCEFSAAVENAIPSLKQTVDFVATKPRGGGVQELVRHLLRDDLQSLNRKVTRHNLLIGTAHDGKPVNVPAYGENLIFTGSSGGGKSTLAKGFLERLVDANYQFCVIDPEGDYEGFEQGVVLGDRKRVPANDEIMQVLSDPSSNLIINLLGVGLDERPAFFSALLTEITEMRARTGRPHWLIVDEAHHVLPEANRAGSLTLPTDLVNAGFITIAPSTVLAEVLARIDVIFSVGEDPYSAIVDMAEAIGEDPPANARGSFQRGEGLFWRPSHGRRKRSARTVRFRSEPTRFEHRRHRRKYAEGDVGPDLSFYFTGKDHQLNLKAQNLIMFTQIAAGLDDDTWEFHLRRGDYSAWFRDVIKDTELAEEAKKLETRRRLSARETREIIRSAIDERYTLPATDKPSGIVDPVA